MKEFNCLMEYREYYIYDCENEVFCIATGAKHNEALSLYTHFVDTYFKDEYSQWKFEIALDYVHNFSADEIKTIQNQGKIFMFHRGYGMYVRNHYVYSSKKHPYLVADSVSSSIETLIYTIVLPVYNCFSKEFMRLEDDFDFKEIKNRYGRTQPIIGQMLTKLAEPDNTMSAQDALKTIRATIIRNLGPSGFPKIAIPIAENHIEKYGHISQKTIELSNALYSPTRLYHKQYNQLQAIIEMRVPIATMEPYAKLKTLEETKDYIIDNLGLSEEDSLCMAECAIAIGKKQREVLDRK